MERREERRSRRERFSAQDPFTAPDVEIENFQRAIQEYESGRGLLDQIPVKRRFFGNGRRQGNALPRRIGGRDSPLSHAISTPLPSKIEDAFQRKPRSTLRPAYSVLDSQITTAHAIQ
jgi:hypothetical protein